MKAWKRRIPKHRFLEFWLTAFRSRLSRLAFYHNHDSGGKVHLGLLHVTLQIGLLMLHICAMVLNYVNRLHTRFVSVFLF